MKFSKGQLRERWFVLDGKRDVLEYYKIKKERHDVEPLFKLKTQGPGHPRDIFQSICTQFHAHNNNICSKYQRRENANRKHPEFSLCTPQLAGAQKTIHITAETVVRIYDSNFGPPQGFEKRFVPRFKLTNFTTEKPQQQKRRGELCDIDLRQMQFLAFSRSNKPSPSTNGTLFEFFE